MWRRAYWRPWRWNPSPFISPSKFGISRKAPHSNRVWKKKHILRTERRDKISSNIHTRAPAYTREIFERWLISFQPTVSQQAPISPLKASRVEQRFTLTWDGEQARLAVIVTQANNPMESNPRFTALR